MELVVQYLAAYCPDLLQRGPRLWTIIEERKTLNQFVAGLADGLTTDHGHLKRLSVPPPPPPLRVQ